MQGHTNVTAWRVAGHMGTVHDLLEERGKQAVLTLDFERNIVEAAASYLADEEAGIGFLYSGWTQAALPHRRLDDDAVWQITSEKVTFLLEPGRRPSGVDGVQPGFYGVPYGSRARLIMLYLQSEALRTGCREVQLGKSLRGWLTNMGIPAGGRSINDVREQAERISRCRLTFHIATGATKSAVDAGTADAEPARYGGGSQLLFMSQTLDFSSVSTGLTPLVDAACLGKRGPFKLTLATQVGLELGKHAQHVEERLASATTPQLVYDVPQIFIEQARRRYGSQPRCRRAARS